MTARTLAILSVLSVLSPIPSQAADWIRLTSPHFEMYTTNGQKQALSAIQHFEQTRSFFMQLSQSKITLDVNVRIIAFRSPKEYQPYRFNEGAFAYYLRSKRCDYIVMQDIERSNYRAAVHEYMHLFVEHLDLKFPLWFNEGLAEFYSSLEPDGDKAVVGKPLEDRLRLLNEHKRVDLDVLFAVDHSSPYYNDKEKMGIFYSEGWALTHMLALSPKYRPKFPEFFKAMASGISTTEVLQKVYKVKTKELMKDLGAYATQTSFFASVFDIKLEKSALEVEVTEASPFVVDLALADLLAANKGSRVEASRRLSKLAVDNPENVEVLESLGYFAFSEGNSEKGLAYFKSAIGKGSKNTEMMKLYAQMLQGFGSAPDEAVGTLRKVVAMKPTDQEAWFELGMVSAGARQCGAALSSFSHITSVNEERGFRLFYMQAFCLMNLKAPEQARTVLAKALVLAKTPEQKEIVQSLTRRLETPEQANNAEEDFPPPSFADDVTKPKTPRPRIVLPGVVYVEGTVKSFDCSPPVRRLHVQVNSKEMVFALDDPDKVVVRRAKDEFIDISCGPQTPVHVGIFYLPTPDPKSSDGLLRELDF